MLHVANVIVIIAFQTIYSQLPQTVPTKGQFLIHQEQGSMIMDYRN